MPNVSILSGPLADTAVKAMDVMQPLWTGPTPELRMPETWEEHVIQTTMLPEVMAAGFRVAGAGTIPMQMFGYGCLLQETAQANLDKVLLLQIGDVFGTTLCFGNHGVLMQVWISKEDLAAGRFDQIDCTMELLERILSRWCSGCSKL